MIHIYYDSRTGNVQRFMDKVAQITGWQIHKITADLTVKDPGHLVTFTTNFGQVPENTKEFMKQDKKNKKKIGKKENK